MDGSWLPWPASAGAARREQEPRAFQGGTEARGTARSAYKTTEVYADFAPDPTQGAMWAERAFGSGERPEERARLF
jgi:hypothetical protein